MGINRHYFLFLIGYFLVEVSWTVPSYSLLPGKEGTEREHVDVEFVGLPIDINYTLTISPGLELNTSKDINRQDNLISKESRSAICHAQCIAKCEDIRIGKVATPVNLSTEFPGVNFTGLPGIEFWTQENCVDACSTFSSDEWIDECDNKLCVHSCQNIKNGSLPLHWAKQPCQLNEVQISQLTSRLVRLLWQDVMANSSQNYTVMYVVEMLVAGGGGSEAWNLLDITYQTFYEYEVDVCDPVWFRVAAVNQFGTRGFSTSQPHTDLPVPGTITNISQETPTFNKPYFYYTITFDPPSDWRSEDIAEYKIDVPMSRISCTATIRPPLPLFDVIRDIPNKPGSKVLILRLYESAFSCVYQIEIQAISNCGVKGEIFNLPINVNNCEEIDGYPCKNDFIPPGAVTEVLAEPQPSAHTVMVTWSGPDDLGSSTNISYFLLQWGLVDLRDVGSPSQKLIEEGRVLVQGDTNATELPIDKSNSLYGVKVLGLVPDLNDSYIEETLLISKVQATFSITTKSAPQTAVLVSVSSAVLLFVALLGVIVYKHRRDKSSGFWMATTALDTMPTKVVDGRVVDNPLYPRKSGPLDEWEVDRARLVTGDTVLGRGAFGQVTLGKLYSPTGESYIQVAVKMLLDTTEVTHHEDFLKEIELMKGIGAHSHVVSMVGCVTAAGGPLCLLVDYVPHGDLLHYLRAHRKFLAPCSGKEGPSLEKEQMTFHDLLCFARQIAVGMEFLSQKGFVHRDLATRNILVGENRNVKIGDFGLTRYVYDDKVYVTRRAGKLPLKWMAIEAIFDLTFTTASDVWSFGVVLFELVTLGGTPYPTISHRHLLARLRSGYRMDCPDNCPTQLYETMRQCWLENPADRPSFTDLKQNMDALIEEHTDSTYLAFDQTKDYYQANTNSSSDSAPQLDADFFQPSSPTTSDDTAIEMTTIPDSPPSLEHADRMPSPPPRRGSPRIPFRQRVNPNTQDLLRVSASSADGLLGSSVGGGSSDAGMGSSWPGDEGDDWGSACAIIPTFKD